MLATIAHLFLDFHGANCELHDLCIPDPCIAVGTCAPDGQGGYACVPPCAEGYTGDQCDQLIDQCQPNLCKNGGICRTVANSFICFCPFGYIGTTCDQVYDFCADVPCQNGAQCVSIEGTGFQCNCLHGYEGLTCNQEVDFCQEQLCLHGATCMNIPGDNFYCNCPFGYTGQLCETPYNFCEEATCKNGATCISPPGENFKCICAGGFTGHLCDRVPGSCTSEPCFNNGQCFSDIEGYRCLCPPDYAGTFCEVPILGCDTKPCRNQAECINNLDGSYSCACSEGFYGLTCGLTLADVKAPCPIDSGSCTCPDEPTEQGCEAFNEPCVEFYYGQDCDVFCMPTDSCQGHYSCSSNGDKICMAGYRNVDSGCTQRDFQGIIDPSCPSFAPCHNGGTCWNQQCCCQLGYEGDRCGSEIDECKMNNNPCLNGGSCVDLLNAYKCLCINGRYFYLKAV